VASNRDSPGGERDSAKMSLLYFSQFVILPPRRKNGVLARWPLGVTLRVRLTPFYYLPVSGVVAGAPVLFGKEDSRDKKLIITLPGRVIEASKREEKINFSFA
jgi:hypothetical protein